MRSAMSTAAAPLAAMPQSGHADAELVEQPAEALAILGEVDGVEGCSEDAEARRLDRARQLQRRLPAELDHDAFRLLALADGEHGGRVERLEIEPVGGVVVGRHRLGVAVDHHGLVAECAERLHRVHAAVVELDALADPVRARAEDDDAFRGPGRRLLVALAPGRVEVVRPRRDLAGTRVDAPEHGRRGDLPRLFRRQAPQAPARRTDEGLRAASRSHPRGRASPSRTPRGTCGRSPSSRRPTSSACRASGRRLGTSRTRTAGS